VLEGGGVSSVVDETKDGVQIISTAIQAGAGASPFLLGAK
tara:strand:- start:415 stop:534 length:120 start_codon:yes stop_codon:yes gene_type:complete